MKSQISHTLTDTKFVNLQNKYLGCGEFSWLAEWNSECGFSLEIFQLFGHFGRLQGLNLVSITSLGLVWKQIWTGSVLEKAGAGEVSERE